MRIVYVFGFFKHVLEAIQREFPIELQTKSVIFIAPASGGGIDVKRFKELFYDSVTRGAESVCVLMAIPRGGAEYFSTLIEGILQDGIKRSHTNLDARVDYYRDARDIEGVLNTVREFKPKSGAPYPPSSLGDLREWTQLNLGGKVVILPRALKAGSKSRYCDPPLVYRCLSLLAEEYRNMRMCPDEKSLAPLRERYDKKVEELGVEITPSITDGRAGEQGDDYRVKYPLGTDATRILDMHVKKGVDREARNCLRIYFFWEDSEETVVVGWMPSHLGTRAS